jgi:general secretion pathway protein H
MRAPTATRGQAAGFTLLEMLVVLALIGLVTGLSAQLLRPPSAKLRVEGAARTLCATFRAARAHAIAMNTETMVKIDVALKAFYSPTGQEVALPREAVVEIDIASSQRQSSQIAGILFYPDGSSTGGDVTIDLSGRRATVGVNWLTGETQCNLS